MPQSTKASRLKHRLANEALRAEKAEHNGLGRRELRRMKSGKRQPRDAVERVHAGL